MGQPHHTHTMHHKHIIHTLCIMDICICVGHASYTHYASWTHHTHTMHHGHICVGQPHHTHTMHHGHIIHTLCIMDASYIMDTCIIHALCIMDTSAWVSRIIHTLCIMDASYTHYASWTHLRGSHGLRPKSRRPEGPQTRSWGSEGPLNF